MVNKSVVEHFESLKAITRKLNIDNISQCENDLRYDHPGNDIEDYTNLMNNLIHALENNEDITIITGSTPPENILKK